MMNKKGTALLVTAALTLGISTGAVAATGLQPIKAYLNSTIALKVGGSTVQAKDASGKVMLPITYNGTTYLPVRAVGDLMDIPVTYDSASSSVSIGGSTGTSTGGSGSGTTPGGSDSTSSANQQTLSVLGTTVLGTSILHTKDPADTVYNGKDYKDVYLNKEPQSYTDFQIMTNNKYSKLHLELGVLNGNQQIDIKDLDGISLKKVSLSSTQGIQSVDVDVSGTKAIFVQITDYDKGSVLFVPLTTSYLVRS
ncbi:hypothetical protein [Paenibacillus sp. WLX2291]|uniref:hypothetical protein n=1 Tax=Paenibacillus sp. WLX2291 TaxID=3296934 RepID=UPI0039845439